MFFHGIPSLLVVFGHFHRTAGRAAIQLSKNDDGLYCSFHALRYRCPASKSIYKLFHIITNCFILTYFGRGGREHRREHRGNANGIRTERG